MKKQFYLRLILFVSVLAAGSVQAQQWGLYTLYASSNGTQAFLIDTASTPVTYKTWTFTSTYKNGYSAYLLPGDTLLRSVGRSGNALSGGGITGEVQKVLWNGTVAWDFVYSSSTYCLHHDICGLPNGNVLMISYDVKSSSEATQAGASSASTGIWSEKIIEVKPTSPTTGTIVWEWKLWDHLCQNYDASKDNYVTSIVNNPQLMNINASSGKDRFHMNGIDYNAALDQIVVSMHFTNELYVIDHSTTTAQAATHTGGNSNKGGDFLYRWGKPANYGASGTTIFNVIHDAHWVPSDNPDYPNYLCAFNNKGGTGGRSAYTILNPPYSGSSYNITLGQAFAPATYDHQYTSSYTANDMGNSQQLPNGNVLMCVPGMGSGYIFEVNSAGTTLWSKTATSSHAYRYTLCYVRGPLAAATASPATLCAGETVNLGSTAASPTETNPVYSYAWTSDVGGFTASTQNTTATPSANTIYTVTITNTALGCTATAEVAVNVYPAPSTPVITQNGNSLSSSPAVAYQWYLNGSPIGGATAQSYIPAINGDYTVEVTDANGCSSMSAVFSYTFTSVEIAEPVCSFSVHPNPTNGIVYLDKTPVDVNGYTVSVYNATGRLVLREVNAASVDISAFSEGIYLLMIESGNRRIAVQKIILSK